MRFIDSCSTSTLGAQNWTYADQNDAACEQCTSPIATSSRFRQCPFSSTPWCNATVTACAAFTSCAGSAFFSPPNSRANAPPAPD